MVVKSRGKSPKCLSIENKIFRYNEGHAREAMSTVGEKPPIYFSYCDEKQAILDVDTVLSRTQAVGFHYETYMVRSIHLTLSLKRWAGALG